MSDIRDVWEERASLHGESPSGVLFKGFTPNANSRLDAWHTLLMQEVLAPQIRNDGIVLDLGCGYGRLSRALSSRRPDLKLIGQDVSHQYCKRFAESNGDAIQANLEAIPFMPSSMAAVFAVTSLMYVDHARIAAVLTRIRKLLEPDASALIIDPGEEMRLSARRISRAAIRSSTGGHGFRRAEYLSLVRNAGFKVVGQGGNPLDSFLFATTLGGRLAWPILSRLLPKDGSKGGYSAFALHRWLLLKASAGSVEEAVTCS